MNIICSKVIKQLLPEAIFSKHLGGSSAKVSICDGTSAGLELDRGGS